MKGKKVKTKPKAKAKTVEAELVVEESEKTKSLKSNEIVSVLISTLKDLNVTGYILSVADSEGSIVPFASANSVGNLLTMKWAIEKEIERIINNTKEKKGDSASPTQQ